MMMAARTNATSPPSCKTETKGHRKSEPSTHPALRVACSPLEAGRDCHCPAGGLCLCVNGKPLRVCNGSPGPVGITVGPRGERGPAGAPGIGDVPDVYGEIFFDAGDEIGTSQILPPGGAVFDAFNANGLAAGTTPDAAGSDGITVGTTGVYRVDYTVSYTSSPLTDIRFAVALNGNRQPNAGTLTTSVPPSGDAQGLVTAAASGLVTMSAGDLVQLFAEQPFPVPVELFSFAANLNVQLVNPV